MHFVTAGLCCPLTEIVLYNLNKHPVLTTESQNHTAVVNRITQLLYAPLIVLLNADRLILCHVLSILFSTQINTMP